MYFKQMRKNDVDVPMLADTINAPKFIAYYILSGMAQDMMMNSMFVKMMAPEIEKEMNLKEGTLIAMIEKGQEIKKQFSSF